MNNSDLRLALQQYPCLPLAPFPTPLTFLPRLSDQLGRPFYIKRDDDIGPGLGGNKTRQLAYILAHALEIGARKVATYGGLQSNHTRNTAAAARKLGMEPYLFYFERRPARLRGNLLLNDILGARMFFLPIGGGSPGSLTLERTISLVRLLARLRLGRHYFIEGGGHSWRGALGYVEAAVEIQEQARALGIDEALVVTAAGTGGTLAGLWAGFELLGSPIRPLGIDVGRLWKSFPASIASLASETAGRLGEARTYTAADTPLIESTYVGAQYGVPSDAGTQALLRLARAEGILLDPIYTAKAFAGLLDLLEQGKLGRGEPLIFLHTGGTPALFA
jgi:L-cysteate sulfo-lyase